MKLNLSSKNRARLLAFGVLIIAGYYQYVESYQFPKWKVFLSGIIMAAPFSLGLCLSSTAFGLRYRFFVSSLILFSSRSVKKLTF
jgi:hypothetical protein